MKPNAVGRVGGDDPRPRALPSQPAGTGLLGGTIVLTLDGELPVEYLSPGDRIITRDSGMARLSGLVRQPATLPLVDFAAGSLGDTRPDRNLTLPTAQRVLVRDWRARALFGAAQALVPAAALVDGEFVRALPARRCVLHQLVFDHPHIVYAGGLELAGHEHEAQLRPAA